MHDPSEQPIKVPRFEPANGFQTTLVRSKSMSKIKGKNTKSEKLLRKTLWGLGIRYRKNDPRLPGKPDIVIPRYKLVIFIDGEFWHGHDWESKKDKIKSNRKFWVPKIERNMQRDRANNELLAKSGWQVFRFWDQEIKKQFGTCLKKILDYIGQEY
jgi:DNA mismatch endonuclease (patch repair protein)